METPTFLYKPNFCAECGEKIERESWHFWTSRRFCENCEPAYRLNRIFPFAFLGVVILFAGIILGQMGQGSRKTAAVPLLSTTNEKAQNTVPKQFLAAEQQTPQ